MKQRPFIVDKAKYPFKSNWFGKNGDSIHYIDEGEGIPIVLTHGNPDWSFLNRIIIKELSSEARLIAYDLPGFGFSDTAPDYGFTPQKRDNAIQTLATKPETIMSARVLTSSAESPSRSSTRTTRSEPIRQIESKL